ncbi:MAG: LEA type 2 family protein [Bacteroidetes bacterium]|nr:LEA type 2 family protein [Bacteroidota bacterium]
MKYIAISFLSLFLLTSCNEIEEPELVEIKKLELIELKGTVAKIQIDAEIENPNFFGIKVKPSVLDVYIDEVYAGTVNLDENVKLLRKSSNTYSVPITLKGESFVLLRLMQWMNKPQINLRLKGKVKGSVYGVSKKIAINETKIIYPEKFKSKIGF